MTNTTGEVAVMIGGQEYILYFSWADIGKIREKFGEDALQQMTQTMNPELAAYGFAQGAKKNHPDMTVKKIMELSPPLVEVIKALDKALGVALFGAETVEELEKLDNEEVPEDAEKKT